MFSPTLFSVPFCSTHSQCPTFCSVSWFRKVPKTAQLFFMVWVFGQNLVVLFDAADREIKGGCRRRVLWETGKHLSFWWGCAPISWFKGDFLTGVNIWSADLRGLKNENLPPRFPFQHGIRRSVPLFIRQNPPSSKFLSHHSCNKISKYLVTKSKSFTLLYISCTSPNFASKSPILAPTPS